MTAEIRSSGNIHQWGGAAFVLGNLLFMVNKFNDMSRLFLGRLMPDVISGQNPALIFLGQVSLIFGYSTYYRFYARGAVRSSKNALRLFSGGGMVLALGHFGFMAALRDVFPQAEALFVLVFLGLLILLVGCAQSAPTGLGPLVLAAIVHRIDGRSRFFPVQRRGNHGDFSGVSHAVCAGPDRSWCDPLVGKADSIRVVVRPHPRSDSYNPVTALEGSPMPKRSSELRYNRYCRSRASLRLARCKASIFSRCATSEHGSRRKALSA
jgi:hypothetical protein